MPNRLQSSKEVTKEDIDTILKNDSIADIGFLQKNIDNNEFIYAPIYQRVLARFIDLIILGTIAMFLLIIYIFFINIAIAFSISCR